MMRFPAESTRLRLARPSHARRLFFIYRLPPPDPQRFAIDFETNCSRFQSGFYAARVGRKTKHFPGERSRNVSDPNDPGRARVHNA